MGDPPAILSTERSKITTIIGVTTPSTASLINATSFSLFEHSSENYEGPVKATEQTTTTQHKTSNTTTTASE